MIRDLLVQEIAKRSLNKSLSLLILKSSYPRCTVEKDALKNFTNFTGKHLCWSLFLIKLQGWGPSALLKRNTNAVVFQWNLWNFSEHLLLRTIANDCCCIFMYVYLQYMKKIQLTQCVIRTLLNIHDRFFFFRKQLTTCYFHKKVIS